MAKIIVTWTDVELLREVAEILRQGRVRDLVHERWPHDIEELAKRFAWDMMVQEKMP